MKYMFLNSYGYYKFCRKLPYTNKQFIFSLHCKDYSISKEIVSIFILKSNPYFKYLKTLSKGKVMEIIYEIENQLNEYKKQALQEYSELEKSRQLQFSLKNENGKYVDGSNPEPIKHWMKELSKYISGEYSQRELQEFGKKVLKRTTIELKQFFSSLSDNENKIIFLQKLIKTESDLLKTDFTRWRENFDVDYIVEQNKSGILKEILNKIESGELIQKKNLDNNIDPSKEHLRTKTKYEVVHQYIEEQSKLPSFKNLKDKIAQPLTILLQSSEKEYLVDYEEDDYIVFFNTLLYTPKNITKKEKIFIDDYDGNYVSMCEDFQNDDIELYHYDNLEYQSVKNLKEKFSECKKFLKKYIGKYVNKNYLEDNTNFSDQHIAAVGTMSKERLPFEDYELKKMIELMIEDELYKNDIDSFYIILIALLSGMRVEEICKLNCVDIKEENKINYFSIRGKVKTKTSVRKVPIHKYLVEKFNFLEFVDSRKDNEKLFNLKPLKLSNKIKYSHYFLRNFGKFRNRFVSEERIKTDLVSFHSYRHTTATRLNEKGIPYLETAALLGHQIDKKLMTVGYVQPSLTKNNKNLQRIYLNDIKYDLEKLSEEFKVYSNFFS